MSTEPARSEYMDEELSFEQVQDLLRRAEARLNSAQMLQQELASITKLPKLDGGNLGRPYILTAGDIARVDEHDGLDPRVRQLASQKRVIENSSVKKHRESQTKKATAGSDWYNLPKTNLTPELKRDLQLLRMRNVLDPKRHYKKDNGKAKFPEFSQIGTIIEGPTEFFSARLNNRDRKQTLTEEILQGERSSGKFKSKYGEIQVSKSSGKKAHYKALTNKKYGRNNK